MNVIARLAPVLCLSGVLSLAILNLAVTGAAEPSPGLEVLRPLPMDGPLSASFQQGEVHRYSVDLEDGEFLLVEVAQQGIDVVVALVDAEGHNRLKVDSLGGAFTTERFGFVTETAGNFEVAVFSPEALRSNLYTIHAWRSRSRGQSPARARDRRYAEASLNLSNARGLLEEGSRRSLDRARLLFQQASDVWHKQDEIFQQALAEAYLGRVWRKLKWPTEELAAYEKALRTLENADADRRGLADVQALEADLLLNAGRLHRRRGHLEEADRVYARALGLFRRLGDGSNEATVLSGQATLATQEGEFETALEKWNLATDRYRQLNRRSTLLNVLRQMSDARLRQGKMDDALDLARDALEVAEEVGEAKAMAVALSQLGRTHHRRGELGKALEAFDRAIGQARLPEILDGRAQVDVDLGRWDQAEAQYQEALDIYRRQLNSSNEEHGVLVHLAELALARGQIPLAFSYVDQALSWCRQAGKRAEILDVLVLRSRVRSADGDIEKARVDLDEALEILEKQLAEIRSPGVRFSFLEARREIFEHYVDLLIDLAAASGDFEEALYGIERYRSRLLRELLEESTTKHQRQADPKYREREARFWEELEEIEVRRFKVESLEGRPDVLEKLAERERKLRRLRESSQAKMLARSSAYAAVSRSPALDLNRVRREYLDSDTAILVFSLGEARSHLLRITQDRVDHHQLAPRAEIERQARKFHRFLATSYFPLDGKEAERYARSLGQLLLSQLVDDPTEKRRVIVPDGALNLVPFAALRSPVDNRWLIQRREITYLPSISALDSLRRTPSSPLEWTVAAVADPVFELDDERVQLDPKAPTYNPPPAWIPYQRLHGSRTEAKNITSLLPPQRRRLLTLDFDANREMVMDGRLSSFDVVHFATHGVVDTRRSELSGLVLSRVDKSGQPRPNGILRLYDIFNLDLPAEMVVLSSCGSGLGQETRGEGVLGLNRGFFYAGASRLLVSLWKINDEVTAELMEGFYYALLVEGQRPAAALRTAQLSMLETTPHAWAAFVHQGDWR